MTTRSLTAPEPPRGSALARAQVTGAVLCGGASRRMGRDKALIELDGQRLIDRSVAALSAVCGRTLLACGSQPRYGELGLEQVLDAGPGEGPLRGLLAALEAASTPWLAVVAADMPRVDGALLAELLEQAAAQGLDACLARTAEGPEPLCAVYHTRCASAVRAALERGERRLIAFHSDVRVGYRDLGPDASLARNLNTPEELERERSDRGADRGAER